MSFSSRRLYVQLPCHDVTVVPGRDIVEVRQLDVEDIVVPKCTPLYHSPKPSVGDDTFIVVPKCTALYQSPKPSVGDDTFIVVPKCTALYHSPKPGSADDVRRALLVDARQLPILRAQLEFQLHETEEELREICEVEDILKSHRGYEPRDAGSDEPGDDDDGPSDVDAG